MKALHCYSSDLISNEDEEEEIAVPEVDFQNETFSKSSGNIVEEKITMASRFSDISSKSINKSNIRGGGVAQDMNQTDDES